MTSTRPHVLVVDDEPNLCVALKRILAKEGYRVSTAGDGQAALQLVEKQKPDALVLDVMMPGMDGREVCRRVREISPSTHVIYFSAKVEPTGPSRLRLLKREADAFVAKPATARRILSTIGNVLAADQERASGARRVRS